VNDKRYATFAQPLAHDRSAAVAEMQIDDGSRQIRVLDARKAGILITGA
jgi:hypothetical protein